MEGPLMEPLRPDDPRQVGPYRLDGRLGAGGMGEVFRGVSPGGRLVAVKLIRAEFATDPQFRSRFAREIEAARKVGGFHTAQVVDADPDAESPWMVTAFVPGPSLRQVVVRQGPLPPGEVRRAGAAIAEGLKAIHESGLVHRDLKPGNVIMSSDGPRIIDFGIARAADATSLTSAGVVVGTFSFMSPEQVCAEETGPPGDVFSLGCLLAYTATGRGPFDAPTIPAIVHRITDGEPTLDGLTDDLRDIVAACVAKDPAQRPTVPDLITRLTTPQLPAATPHAPQFAPDNPQAAPLGAHAAAPGAQAAALSPQAAAPGAHAAAPGPQAAQGAPHGHGGQLGFPGQLGTVPGGGVPAVTSPRGSGGPSRRALLIGGGAAAAVAVLGGTAGVLLWPESGSAGQGDVPATPLGTPVPTTLPNTAVDMFQLAFSADGKRLSGLGFEALWNWDLATGQGKVAELDFDGWERPYTLSADGRIAAAGTRSGTFTIRDVLTGKAIGTLPSGTRVQSVALSPDGRLLAYIGQDNSLQVWDVSAKKTVKTVPNYARSTQSVLLFSADGRDVLLGEGAVKRTRVADAPVKGATLGVPSAVTQIGAPVVAVGPSGSTMASSNSTGDYTIYLGPPDDHGSTKLEGGHKGQITTLAFSPDGKVLASGAEDGLVCLWHVPTARQVASVTADPKQVECVTFSPDGQSFASGGRTGVTKIWTFPGH
ncbi:WD40 repeat domain-containing serine/threonine protein kinase [Actinomadura rupiterrae]|uniref:WD40 repeat domain-containing serine/threonine protein kinase n=1 Tax=Actinomadura rupiterrae TaxID=559627 RepID=UPI0020A453AA|nr:serine/threonine-protein kinase [Actinomadura rupiterrae]MCP2340720.1 hypothetical protein [Actinomadura rupiterrae]